MPFYLCLGDSFLSVCLDEPIFIILSYLLCNINNLKKSGCFKKLYIFCKNEISQVHLASMYGSLMFCPVAMTRRENLLHHFWNSKNSMLAYWEWKESMLFRAFWHKVSLNCLMEIGIPLMLIVSWKHKIDLHIHWK